MAKVLERRHRRTGGRVLHDCVHDGNAHGVQPELAEGMPREPPAARRDVRGVGDENRGRPSDGRGGRAKTGHRHDDVADVCAERAAVRAHAVGGCLERPDKEARSVHAIAVVW